MELLEFVEAYGSFFGTLGGILIANKLTTYRIEQLEKKVEKHNNVIHRTYILEETNKVQDKELEIIKKAISKLEDKK